MLILSPLPPLQVIYGWDSLSLKGYMVYEVAAGITKP